MPKASPKSALKFAGLLLLLALSALGTASDSRATSGISPAGMSTTPKAFP